MLILAAFFVSVIIALALAHCCARTRRRKGVRVALEAHLACDSLFLAADVDGDGAVYPSELLKQMIKAGETPSVAHELVRRLDRDFYGLVSLEEWRVGWHNRDVLAVELSRPDDACAPTPAAPTVPATPATAAVHGTHSRIAAPEPNQHAASSASEYDAAVRRAKEAADVRPSNERSATRYSM